MFTFTRKQLQTFQTLLRRAKLAKARGGAPRLTLAALGDRCALQAVAAEIAIELSVATPCAGSRMAFPADALSISKGKAGDAVTFRQIAADRLLVEWIDAGIPQTREHAALSTDGLPTWPTAPEQLAPQPSHFWQALRDAAATADASRSRYALDCLQLRGARNEIAATDGRQLLLQSGFEFPWDEDLLVPAREVLGCKELAGADMVSLGRRGDWLTLTIGPWRLALRIDQEARFPQTDAIVPANGAAVSRLTLADADAAFLAATLGKLPGADDPHQPVTLDLNGQVAVRARSGDSSPTELRLKRSAASGEPLRWQTNRKFLNRAVQLGFREFAFASADGPGLGDDGRRQYVWASLGKEGTVGAADDAVGIDSTVAAESARRPPSNRSFVLETTPSMDPPATMPFDPFVAIESLEGKLRSALNDVARLEAGFCRRQGTRLESETASAVSTHERRAAA